VRRAEDLQRISPREEAADQVDSQSDSQLAAAVAAERMKWQAEAEQRVAAERREKEQAVELLKLAEARLRAMPTVDPALEAKWKADMELRVAQTRAALTADAAAAMQAAETKWKSETDQRFAIAEEMFKEIYEEQFSAAEAKWRADENQRFAAAREAWMVDARTKGLGGGGDSSLASSIEATLNAKFELKVADIESRFLAQREAAIAEARRQWESSEIDRLIDAQSEFQVNADRRMKELEIRLAQFGGQIASRAPVRWRGQRLPARAGGRQSPTLHTDEPACARDERCWRRARSCATAAVAALSSFPVAESRDKFRCDCAEGEGVAPRSADVTGGPGTSDVMTNPCTTPSTTSGPRLCARYRRYRPRHPPNANVAVSTSWEPPGGDRCRLRIEI
jgi:hypothetical protein